LASVLKLTRILQVGHSKNPLSMTILFTVTKKGTFDDGVMILLDAGPNTDENRSRRNFGKFLSKCMLISMRKIRFIKPPISTPFEFDLEFRQ